MMSPRTSCKGLDPLKSLVHTQRNESAATQFDDVTVVILDEHIISEGGLAQSHLIKNTLTSVARNADVLLLRQARRRRSPNHPP